MRFEPQPVSTPSVVRPLVRPAGDHVTAGAVLGELSRVSDALAAHQLLLALNAGFDLEQAGPAESAA